MKKVKKYQAGGTPMPEAVPLQPAPLEPAPFGRGVRNDDLPDQAAVNALRARGRAMQAASQMRGGRRGMPSRPSRMASMKKGGKVKARKMDGCAMKGKTRGRMR